MLERADFRNDLYIFGDLSMDTLDYAGPRVNEGSKGVLLALGEKRRSLPTVFEGDPPPQLRHVEVFCDGCLVVDGAPSAREPDLPVRVARDPAFADWPLIVLADNARHCACSTTNFLWTTFTRFNPAADIHAKGIDLFRNRPSFLSPIVIDARMKPGYPPELHVDPETAELVDRRWQDYFPDGGVEMGDSDRAHLDTP